MTHTLLKKQTTGFKKTIIATAVASYALLGAGSMAFAQDGNIEEVVVLGVKGAQQTAVNVKRNATSIVDGISAEDIGKLPDVTIADSLQRISGIQVQRDAGEGTKANVRGLPQVVTLLNGEQYLTAGNLTGAQPNLGDIPSQLMKGVNVYKSTDLHNSLSGVTGTIDLRTRRPMELAEGFTTAVSAEASTGDYTGETDPSLNGLINWRNDNLGFMVSGVHSTSTLGNNYSGNTANQWLTDTSWGGNGGADNGYNWMQAPGYDSFNRVVERNRDALNFAFEAEFGEGFKFLAEGFYTKLEGHDRKMGLNIGNRWATLDYMQATQFSDTGVKGGDRNWAAVEEYDVDAWWVNSFSVNDTVNSMSQNYNFQLDYDNGGNFTSSVRAIRGSANNTFISGSTQGDLSNWETTNSKALYRNQLGMPGVDAWFGTGNIELPNFYPAAIAAEFSDRLVGNITGVNGGRYVAPNPKGYGENPQVVYNIAGDHPVWSGFDRPIAGGLTDASGEKSLADYMANKDSYTIGAYDGGGSQADAALNVFSANGKYKFDEPLGGFVTAVEAGIRNSSREVINHEFKLFSNLYAGNGASDDVGCGVQWKAIDVVLNQDQCQAGEMVPHPLAGQTWTNGGNTGVYPAMAFQGYTANPPSGIDKYQPALFLTDFGGVTSGLPGTWVADPAAFDDMEAFLVKAFGSVERVTRPGDSYEVNLVENSSYFITSFEQGIVTGNVGARVIQTDITVKQNQTGPTKNYGDTANDVGDVVSHNSYTDVLPALNLTADVSDDLKIRFAASKTMTPLDLKKYGGGLTVNTKDDLDLNIRTVSNATASGNPNLNPWRATNIDLSAEYYLGSASMVNIALFKVDISSFVKDVKSTGRYPDQDGVIRRTVELTQPGQGEGGSVEGVEIGGKFAFSDVTDGFLSNFGVDTNMTYSPSKSNEKDLSGNELPFYDNSENQFNFIAWYQADKLQARIAYNYRSERYAGEATQGVRLFADATAYVDANISYDVMDDVTVYVNASNLTGEQENYYLDFSKGKTQFASINEFEARYTLGVRAKF